MFDIKNLEFDFPIQLVATQPVRPSRVLYSKNSQSFKEINIPTLLTQFRSGDLLLINNSKVEKRRIIGKTTDSQVYDILFVYQKSNLIWQVLCQSSKIKKQTVYLPEGITVQLIENERPQTVQTSKPLTLQYFEKYGQMPLPFYIQKQRAVSTEKNKRQPLKDELWYQNPYGKITGSSASPTASLHFTSQDLIFLKKRGVKIAEVTLHVGLGTYLPLNDYQINHQKLHLEHCFIPKITINSIESLEAGRKIAALGTTTVRAIESFACGMLQETKEGFVGQTDLMITPGYNFQFINCILTNFHQPKSSLLALIAAFVGTEHVLKGYKWAIARNFRLFSYGDLSVWDKS